jgi:hypothetical protein
MRSAIGMFPTAESPPANRRETMSRSPKILLVASLLAAAVLGSCSPIRSELTIDPGEEFVLGGNQSGTYFVESSNIGSVPVSAARRTRFGTQTEIDRVRPGETVRARFGRGEAAVFSNAAGGAARLRVVVRGDTALGMRYEAAEPSPAYGARRLSPESAAEDVRILRETIERVHPGYGRYTSPAATDALFDALEADVAGGTSDERLYLATSRILARLRCDHTKAELPESIEQHRRETPTHLPFSFRLFDGRMLVDRVAPEVDSLARGDEILSINGRPTGRIIGDIEELVSIDGWTDDTRRIEMEHSSEYLGDAIDHFWPFLYGWADSWTIEARDRRTGEIRRVTLEPVTYGSWLSLGTGDGARYTDFRDSVEFRMLDDTTGYLSIGTFVNYRNPVEPGSVFEPVFDRLRDAGAERLILDLRECGGGSDDVPAALTPYLSADLVPAAKRPPWVRTNNFQGIREHLSTWDESVFQMPDQMFEDLGNGYYELKMPVKEPQPAPERSNRFEGELLVLSSAANASGATMFIALLQEHYGATVVGEPTGGSAEGPTAGIILFLTLPNSGIKVRVPALRSWVNVTDPKPGQGVVPDIEIRPTAESWLSETDPALEAARRTSVRR